MDMPRTWLRPALLCATVLLHAGALLLFLGQQGARPDTSDVAAMDLVWIHTPPPKPPEPPAPARLEPPPKVATAVKAQRRARAAVASKAPAPTPESTLVAVSAAPSTGPAPQTGEAAPFDHEAALETARKIAREVDPVLPGTKYKETRDEKLGRAIAGAKRGNCLSGNGGGNLLTPLMWMLDKKNSGCKF